MLSWSVEEIIVIVFTLPTFFGEGPFNVSVGKPVE
jgi:hypothetical protein